MPGHLQTHPYYKTYDELQRSSKRMQTFLDMNQDFLDDVTKLKVEKLINLMNEAITYIPKKYHLTKKELQKKVSEENED